VLDGSDIILIHQLVSRYGHTLDGRDWEAFTALFVPEATIDYRGSTGTVVRTGRDDVVAWFKEGEHSHPPAHHVTNVIVDESADPTGPVPVDSKFFAPYSRDTHVPKRLYGGDYHDVVIKTPAGWRFLHKQCIPRWNLAVQIDDDAPEHRRTY
jgi:hypothetical protein